jgi:alkanesulfonate monooxygenase SsuD/methylene tetrahydromethanopterin reductase-like flavin-dependent oxidoreductase (luciferase family)
MPKIKFGFMMPADHLDSAHRSTYVADLNQALRLISGHFDSTWIIDHLQDGASDLLESFTTLSYMAALHPQLKFGQAVVCQAYRNPALLAKMGATLQFLSGGRYMLGIGTGWDEVEARAYGYDFPPPRVRVEQLEETLQIVKAMWTESSASFNGRHYRIANAYCEPKPDPVPPIMVGAFGPRMLRITAKYADEWNVSSTGLVEYRRLVHEFENACNDVGRDPFTVRRSWCGGCACAWTQAEAEQIVGDRYSATDPESDFGFIGTPEQITEQMQGFIDAGITSFNVDCGGFPNLTTLELLVRDVLPALND